jgi:hypothetical protein
MEGMSKRNESVRTRPVVLTEDSRRTQPQEFTLSDCAFVLMLSCAVTALVCSSRWQIVQELNKVCQAVILAMKGTKLLFQSQSVYIMQREFIRDK